MAAAGGGKLKGAETNQQRGKNIVEKQATPAEEDNDDNEGEGEEEEQEDDDDELGEGQEGFLAPIGISM